MKLFQIKVLLIFSSAIVFAIASCSKQQQETVSSTISIDSLPSLIGDNINTIVSDSGRISYRMEAPKLAIFDKVDSPYWDFPQGVLMTTFTNKGIEDGSIQSKFAIYYVDKDLWELRQEVVANNPDGRKIETELLYWDQKEKIIYSDAFVKITEDDMITKGTGFKSDEAFEEWSLDQFEIEYIEE